MFTSSNKFYKKQVYDCGRTYMNVCVERVNVKREWTIMQKIINR